MRRRSSALIAVFALLLASPAFGQGAAWLKSLFPKLEVSHATTDLREIESGGVPPDGIPAIRAADFVPVDAATEIGEEEPVMVLAGSCGAYAFPYRILIWHEIVQHEQCGVPVVVTFCPLCNTSMVFDRRVDGQVLDFGVSGLLRNSDLVMFDRQSETLWQQFTGEALVGKYAGKRLSVLPERIESWRLFKAQYPNGKVLVPPPEGGGQYGLNPYAHYDDRAEPFLYHGKLPTNIKPLAHVVRVGDRAWALTYVRDHSPIMTPDGLKIEWREGQNDALESEFISRGRTIGNVSVTRDGREVPFSVDFAFAFYAFYPNGKLVN